MSYNPDAQENWINIRMRALLADDFCPECGKHKRMHDDKKCLMRWTSEEEEISNEPIRKVRTKSQ